MMEFLLAFATLACIGIMSPGPDFVAVTHASITNTRPYALSVALGVVLGNGLWAGAALFGVGTLFALFPSLFIAFKLCGASYLIWVGIQMLRGARKPMAAAEQTGSGSLLRALRKGFYTTASNPKAAIYYSSALSSVAPEDTTPLMLLLLLMIVIVIAAFWFTCVHVVLSTPAACAAFLRLKVYIESFFGAVIACFGISLFVPSS